MENFGARIREYREKTSMTQKQLSEYLYVSDKTISSWENNRTHPDISTLILICDLFSVSLDSLLRKDTTMVKKIDSDIKMKSVYKRIVIISLLLILLSVLFLNLYQYQNTIIDRFNPFLQYQVGYTTLPEKVTYNGGKSYQKYDIDNETDQSMPQYPDPYENIFVMDTPFGEGNYLTFRGGQAPDDKNYAMVLHKGSYVKNIQFLSWESIPDLYKNNMAKKFHSENESKE